MAKFVLRDQKPEPETPNELWLQERSSGAGFYLKAGNGEGEQVLLELKPNRKGELVVLRHRLVAPAAQRLGISVTPVGSLIEDVTP